MPRRVHTEEGRLQLFVAVDRTSKFAYAELHERATRRLAADFRALLADGNAGALGPWLAAAQGSELRPLAASLWRDRAAVEAAAALPWRNGQVEGQVEGQVNRVKLVKRTMYGRAACSLLRRRVLAA